MNGAGVRPQVSETTDSNERKRSGTTRLFTGFVIGALFALAPMYYFYMGREAALRAGHAASDAGIAASPSPVVSEPAAGSGTPPFASRMTYELSRLPEEPLPVVARAPIPPAESPPRASGAMARPAEPPRETRVADARPISAQPPAPRDRTAAIERESQAVRYRVAPSRDAVAVRAPKVFDAREVELIERQPSRAATRPIGADAPATSRAEVAGPPVAGVSPIGGPPERPSSEVITKAKSASVAPAPAASTAEGSVEGRLAATREWLNVAARTTHTIQLMGASNDAQLAAQLKSLGKILEPSRLYVYRTLAQGKPSITVIYGEYPDRKSALHALDQLPPVLIANKPVLRTVSGIRAEMKQHKTDG